MTYILTWKNPAVDPLKTNITVPVASTVTNASSLTFTGKGAANYGKAQQENLMRLLENFADGTAPSYATVGQLWYDSTNKLLKLCTATSPLNWRSLAGVQVTNVGEPAPTSPGVGDLWFERTGPLSGFLYVYTGMGRFPVSGTPGWNQVWPIPSEAALREEYDDIKRLLNDLLTYGADEFSVTRAGNGAIGRLFTALTNFATLDAALNTKVTTTPDSTVNLVSPVDMKAQPYSGDWDLLLSAARWAVERLDVPATFWQDVSPIPFVQDGRQPPAALLTGYTNSPTEPRYPVAERLQSRRYGLVTMASLYAETVNVLNSAIANRYNLKGIAANSGVNTAFGKETAQWIHSRRQGTPSTTNPAFNNVFRWSSDSERDRFVYGGSAIEVVITHTPSGSPSPADTQFQSFLSFHNRFRITADKVRAFNAALTMPVVPLTTGLADVIASPSTVNLGSFLNGGVSVTLQGIRGANALVVFVQLSIGAGITGTTQVTYNIIKDCTAYGADIDLFPSPNAYNDAIDASGSALSNVPVTVKPTANFTVSATSVSTGSGVTLTWTGSGAPTLVEWDVNNDGVYEGTGTTYVTPAFTSANRYTVRVRATNAGGTDILTRPAYIVVT